MHKLKIINSTTRPNRKGPVLTAWVASVAQQHPEFELQVLDLGEINLPMMDEPHHPALQQYQHPHTLRWSTLIAEADAFVMVTAEYNGGIPAPLKNALDYLAKEWAYKPVAIVSYGGVAAGTRSAQMLKQVLTTLKMVPLAESVATPFFDHYLSEHGGFTPNRALLRAAHVMLHELGRWAGALKPLRTIGEAIKPAAMHSIVA